MYLSLVKMRNFLHFEMERLTNWKKVYDKQKHLSFDRSYLRFGLIFICLNIYVGKLEKLKEEFRGEIEKQPCFQEALEIIKTNESYKSVCSELLEQEKSTIEAEIDKAKVKIMELMNKNEQQVEQCKELFQNSKTSFEEKYRIYWKDDNSLKVHKTYDEIQKKIHHAPEFIKNWDKLDEETRILKYGEKVKFEETYEPELRKMRCHVFVELLFHLDVYLRREQWGNEEYLKVEADQFLNLSHQQLLELHGRYLK